MHRSRCGEGSVGTGLGLSLFGRNVLTGIVGGLLSPLRTYGHCVQIIVRIFAEPIGLHLSYLDLRTVFALVVRGQEAVRSYREFAGRLNQGRTGTCVVLCKAAWRPQPAVLFNCLGEDRAQRRSSGRSHFRPTQQRRRRWG